MTVILFVNTLYFVQVLTILLGTIILFIFWQSFYYFGFLLEIELNLLFDFFDSIF